jgi:pimeloyl-ACP methyl ester carboxylesterase
MSKEALSRISMPILIVHGRKDRRARYGGALDWAQQLADTRLLTIAESAHVPWIDAPRTVYEAIRTFLDRGWRTGAERIEKE